MKTRFKKSLLLLICLGLFPLKSFANETITWLVFVWPPVHFVKGKMKGDGMMDGVMNILQKNMPNYEHITLQANVPRIFQKMKAKENVCYVTSLKDPDKETFMHFSIPDSIFLSNSVIVRRNDPNFKAELDSGSISLMQLVIERPMKGGINKTRKYGPGIDPILSAQEAQKKFITLASDTMVTNLMKMLQVKRIDYMIEYPWTIGFLEKEQKTNSFLSLSIEETPYYNLGYASCAKTEWGAKVVQQINEVLLEQRKTPEYRHYMVDRWYDDAGYGGGKRGSCSRKLIDFVF